uniref:Uncharacterized protein n=1 Tax=Branchiostoma floridae TaxID=7739 RepID=C3XU50_BRAFL|eukprot:XP_002612415.1 hypothetical protein BRAFLDRAFT_78270 [Branchiostoma floridae]
MSEEGDRPTTGSGNIISSAGYGDKCGPDESRATRKLPPDRPAVFRHGSPHRPGIVSRHDGDDHHGDGGRRTCSPAGPGLTATLIYHYIIDSVQSYGELSEDH